MNILRYILVGLAVIEFFFKPFRIGKEMTPKTAGEASVEMAFLVLLIFTLLKL